MRRRTRTALATGVVVACGAVAAIAIALGSGQDSPASESSPRPELIPFEKQETYRPGVPDDPYIDFCPTPEQVEAYAERTGGLDLKPSPPDGSGCVRDGQYRLPAELQTPNRTESLPRKERCQREKESLLEPEPIPSDDPLTLRGKKADDGEVGVDIEGDPEFLKREGIHDIHDWARRMGC